MGTEAERGRRRRPGEHSRPGNKMLSRLRLLVPASQSWRLLQHLDRRSQAEQSKIAGIGELLVRLVWKEMQVVEDLL